MRGTLLKSFTVAAVMALSVEAAQAVTVNYQKQNDPFNGNDSSAVSVKSTLDPVTTVHARAGGFFLQGDVFGNGRVENFVGWCLDIAHVLKSGVDYVPTKTPFEQDTLTSDQIRDIGRLFNTAYLGLAFSKGSAESAGFQLALWEIIYEDPTKALDLGTGSLKAWVRDGSDAVVAGQGFLANLGGKVTKRWDLVFLESKNNQDLVTATPVPVPAAAGLLLLALGGLAVVGRRRPTV